MPFSSRSHAFKHSAVFFSTICKESSSRVTTLKYFGASLQEVYILWASVATAMKSPKLKPKLILDTKTDAAGEGGEGIFLMMF